MNHLDSFESFRSDKKIAESINPYGAVAYISRKLRGDKGSEETADIISGTNTSASTSNVEVKSSRNDEYSCPNHDCWTHFGKEAFWNGNNTIGGKRVPEIKVDRQKNLFTITYKGPAFGFLLKHGTGGKGDTIHQLLNVLTTELNPYLRDNKLKPEIKKIRMDMAGSNLSVSVPLIPAPGGAQYGIDRRGGLGHPGDYSGLEKYRSRSGYEEAIHKSANLTEKFVTFVNK